DLELFLGVPPGGREVAHLIGQPRAQAEDAAGAEAVSGLPRGGEGLRRALPGVVQVTQLGRGAGGAGERRRRRVGVAQAVEQEEGVLMAAPGFGDLPLGFEDVPQLVERDGLLAAVAQRLAEGDRAPEALAGAGGAPWGTEQVARGVERPGRQNPAADPHVPAVGLVEQPGGLAELAPDVVDLAQGIELVADGEAAAEPLRDLERL